MRMANRCLLFGVWGLMKKPFNADQIASLIAALKEQGWSIMLGVNDDWRTHSSSKWPRAKYTDIVKSANVIFPWFVGRYGSIEVYNNHRKPIIDADIQWCKKNGVHYAPPLFPPLVELT